MTHSRQRGADKDDESSSIAVGLGFKHIKTKDNAKDLICHMIGIMGLLCKEFRAHLVAKLIKKELSDLKSYF